MNLEPVELWFLDAAVEMRINVDVLSASNIELALNRSGHGLDKTAVIAMLLDLQARGLVEGRDREGSVLLTRERIEIGFHPPRRRPTLWYGLTAEGGARWEHAATPRWELFINEFTDGDEERIEAASAEVAERYFERWLEYGATADSRRDTTFAPWQALYWKTLPRGHRITFSMGPKCGGPVYPYPCAPAWHALHN
jgi:hypothetical protein